MERVAFVKRSINLPVDGKDMIRIKTIYDINEMI